MEHLAIQTAQLSTRTSHVLVEHTYTVRTASMVAAIHHSAERHVVTPSTVTETVELLRYLQAETARLRALVQWLDLIALDVRLVSRNQDNQLLLYN